jgi:transposase InsO family protein
MQQHPSGYYAWKAEPQSASAKDDQRLTGLLEQAWLESGGVYGYRKLTLDMRDLGERCGKRRVARMLKLEGLRSQTSYRRRPGVHGGKPAVVAPNHLQPVHGGRAQPDPLVPQQATRPVDRDGTGARPMLRPSLLPPTPTAASRLIRCLSLRRLLPPVAQPRDRQPCAAVATSSTRRPGASVASKQARCGQWSGSGPVQSRHSVSKVARSAMSASMT